MPNVTIQINEPKVTPSPTYPNFSVRYRLKGTTTWSGYETRSNASYVKDLASGIWEMEAKLVRSALEECEPTIYEIPVQSSCTCLENINLEVIRVGNQELYEVNVMYDTPVSDPPCGYVFVIVNSSGTRRKIFIKSLTGTTQTTLSLNKGDTSVEVYSNCCNEVFL